MEKSGFYPVTHHVTSGHSDPGVGFMMKSSDSNAIALPESYTIIKKSSEGKDSADEKAFAYIYAVNCPSGKTLIIRHIIYYANPVLLVYFYHR